MFVFRLMWFVVCCSLLIVDAWPSLPIVCCVLVRLMIVCCVLFRASLLLLGVWCWFVSFVFVVFYLFVVVRSLPIVLCCLFIVHCSLFCGPCFFESLCFVVRP